MSLIKFELEVQETIEKTERLGTDVYAHVEKEVSLVQRLAIM
jgi:hypothetical protein